MSETSMTRIDISDGDNSCNQPLIGPTTIKIWSCPFYWTRKFIST